MNAIQIKDVTKSYHNAKALDHVSFSFEFGKVYGLLGRNGAGKSTLINIITNRIFADEGEVLIDGLSAKENMEVHDKIFCLSDADLYEGDLKVKDIFKWTNRFYQGFDIKKAYEIAEKFKLSLGKRFKALSKGYKAICKITVALALDVPYIIFDEPVLGLDANHRELFYSLLLKEYEKEERTFILVTHLIEEVANIIEEVVLIDGGKVLLQENVGVLLEQGYSVSGLANDVDSYCIGKNVIGYDELAGLKIAYILGEKTSLPQNSSLRISAMNLQKLFVKLTQEGGQINE